MSSIIKSKQFILDLLLVGIIAILSLIIFPKFTNLLINSDSYAIVLPALFLQKFGTFGAQLGEHGDIFSPIFYRGGFSLFIFTLSSIFNLDWMVAGRIIIQFSYFLSIILTYFVSKKIFSNPVVGFCASLFLIFCYIYSHWSTVLMSEIPTISLVILSLFFLVFSRSKSYLLYISAIIFGIAFTFRAEMMMLLIPFTILVYLYFKNNLNIVFYILLSLFVWIIYVTALYVFNLDSGFWLSQQVDILIHTLGTHQLFIYTFVLLLIFLGLLIRWPIFAIIPAGFFIYLATKINLDFTSILPPFFTFIYHDLSVIICGLLGLILIFRKSKPLFLFFTFYTFPLLLLYFSRGEYRYYVHTIMPFVILSGYFVYEILNGIASKIKNKENTIWFYSKKIIFILILIIVAVGEFYHYTRPSFLPEQSYEQVVIKETIQMLDSKQINQDNLVICSVFSEAVYYSTKISAQDCFVGLEDINRNPDQNKLIIVEEDISRHQPEFAQHLEENFSHKLLQETWVVTPYIEKNTTSLPKYPIKWYLI